jgi:hypothetical protein
MPSVKSPLIMVGILLALEVSEWQDKRQLQKREALYLDRISNELNRAEKSYAKQIARLEKNSRALEYVFDSLFQESLFDEDQFSAGLYFADILPTVENPITIYDEMLSTGMFSLLRDEELRDLLTQLHTFYESSMVQLPYYRVGLQAVRTALDQLIDVATVPEELRAANYGHPYRFEFDFTKLRENRLLKNQLYEAVDSHGDWLKQVNDIHGIIAQCLERVEVLRGR